MQIWMDGVQSMNKYDKMLEINKKTSEEKIKKASDAIREMLQSQQKITVPVLMKKTGLSRGFFYKNHTIRGELDRALEPLHQQMIGDFGVELKDGRSQLGLTKLDDGRRRWQVEMSEGRNRQIRRTFGALGYTVTRLKRLEFGPYRLSGLQPGEWCELTKANSGAGEKA